MKRALAITLVFLLFSCSAIGCGRNHTGNVSDDPNGMIEQDTTSNSAPSKEQEEKGNSKTRHSDSNNLIDDMEGIAEDVGDDIRDIGRDVKEKADDMTSDSAENKQDTK